MKNLYPFLLALLFATQAFGQRYLTEVFPNVNVSSDLVYGSAPAWTSFNVDLKLDIYQPAGDVLSQRPLMVLAHGGSFVAGSKTEAYMVELCQTFAKRGYVTVSIGYRLGINFANVSGVSDELVKANLRAVQDFNAAIRYFYKSARHEGNPYGVDTNRIIAGGYSAGSLAAIHSQLFYDLNSAPQNVRQFTNQLGGLQGGNNGSAGFPSRAIGLWNMAGAILDTQMVNNPNVATISFHSNDDDVVPYGDGFVYFSGTPIVEMHGSSIIHNRLNTLGAIQQFNGFTGLFHNLFATQASTDTVISKTTRFFYHYVVNNPAVSVNETAENSLLIYPNPVSHNRLYINGLNQGSLSIQNAFGQTIWQLERGLNGKTVIETESFPKGMYLVHHQNERQTLGVYKIWIH